MLRLDPIYICTPLHNSSSLVDLCLFPLVEPHRYRSLAGVCCRVLRLDLLLLAAQQLHSLSAVSHMCEEEDVMEVGFILISVTLVGCD